jgi:hypothetical protein
MIYGIIFGLLFAMAGIYMLITQRGWKAFSKRHDEVRGAEAKTNGSIIGLALVAIMLLVK